MSSLGSLVVSLAANTASFTSDLGKAAHLSAKRMDDIKKSAERAGKAIGAAFVAGSGLAAVLVKQAIDSADALDDLAQKTGSSVEALSALTYVANIEGIALESLSGSMAKLAKNTSDAQRGTGEAKDAFAALGINVTATDGSLKNSEVIMAEVAEKFANMEDGAGKTALAVGIFGRAGADLIPMLNMGSDGLAKATEEARAFGLIMGGETAASAAAFNDNLTRLNMVKQGFANQIMKAVLPALGAMTEKLLDSAKESNSLARAAETAATGVKLLATVGAIVTGVFKTLGESLGGIAAVIVQLFSGRFSEAFDTAKNTVFDFTDNVKSAAGNVRTIWTAVANDVAASGDAQGTKLAAPMIKGAEKAAKASKQIGDGAYKAYQSIERMLDGLAAQADALGKTEKEAEMFRLMMAGANKEQQAWAETILTFIDAKKKEIELVSDGARVYEDTRTPMEKLNQEYARLNTLLQAGAIDWDTYARSTMDAQDKFLKLTDDVKSGNEDLIRSIQGWGKQFTDTFVDGVMAGKLAFSDLANSIISDILRIVVQKTLADKIIGSWGTSGSAGSGILGVIGGMLRTTGKALGGDVAAGTSMLVGENGPEVFSTGVSGTITANAGPSINYAPVIHIDSRTDRKEVEALVVRVNKAGQAELVDQLSRARRL